MSQCHLDLCQEEATHIVASDVYTRAYWPEGAEEYRQRAQQDPIMNSGLNYKSPGAVPHYYCAQHAQERAVYWQEKVKGEAHA